MASEDIRKDFIFSASVNYFGSSVVSQSKFDSSNLSLNNFLDDGNVSVLTIQVTGQTVTYGNKVHIIDTQM